MTHFADPPRSAAPLAGAVGRDCAMMLCQIRDGLAGVREVDQGLCTRIAQVVATATGCGCVVRLLDKSGTVFAHSDAWHAQPAALAAVRGLIADKRADAGDREFVATLRQRGIVRIDTENRYPDASDAGERRLSRAKAAGLRSALGAWISDHGSDHGAISLVRMGSEPPFGEDDVHTMQLVVALVAAAITASRRAEAESRAAQATQERAASDRALAEMADAYRSLFDHSPLPKFAFDTESLRFTDVNAAALALYGYTRDEFCALRLPDLRSDGVPDNLRAGLREDGYWFGLSEHRTKSGQRKRVEVATTLVMLYGQRRRLVAVKDVTEQHRLEEQLRHAQKMEAVGQLAGGIAHDFNNLLNVIFGYAAILEDELAGDERRQPWLAEVIQAARKAADMTRQLLLFSRKTVSQPAPIDVDGVLAALGRTLSRLLGSQIELDVQTRGGGALVNIDPSHLDQLLLNLAVNARDAMPNGGKLGLETARLDLDAAEAKACGVPAAGAWLRIGVTDTGVGMDAATQARIFEPYFTTKGPTAGTGLGLATVYGVVQHAGGAIKVTSAVGVGSCFAVYLPCAQTPNLRPQFARDERPAARPAATVLLVEDDNAVRNAVRESLHRAGFTVLDAGNAADALALAAAASGAIDLLLTDVLMGKTNGPQLAALLRQQEPAVRVLFMSGCVPDALTRMGIEEDSQSFLAKPFTPAALVGKVREVLERPASAASAKVRAVK